MTKRKKLIVLSGVIGGVIVLLLILAFTLFGLKTIEFNNLNQTNILESQEDKNFTINASGLKKNSCVLFLNKNAAVKNIEEEIPYLKVVNIETVFPNKVIIHYAQREEVFAVKSSEDKYFIVDNELKVLRYVENSEGYVSSRNNPILVNGLTVENKTAKVGEKLVLKEHEQVLKNLSRALSLCNRDVVEQKSLFKSIDFKNSNNQEVLTGEKTYVEILDFNDFKINIYAPSTNLNEKMQICLATLPYAVPQYINTHYLEILTNSQGEIFSKLTIKTNN